MSEATITDALLRCTRRDDLAKGAFELVRADLGLWVLELPETFAEIVEILTEVRCLLRSLKTDVSDYTLHIAATVDGVHSLKIPSEVTDLSSDCGFSIEVISST